MTTETLLPSASNSPSENSAPDHRAEAAPVRSRFPSLYQVNTRVSLRDLSQKLGRQAKLDDYPDSTLDRLAEAGFEWVWLLGVWQTGPAGLRISRGQPQWLAEFKETLPDFKLEDVSGSCFAIASYTVHYQFGGNSALDRLRQRIHDRGMRLLLDFVPNHTALDHPWVDSHPEYYIAGTDEQLESAPQNYIRLKNANGSRVLAYGRDPYFAGWPDTLQLNYAEPALQEAMRGELQQVATLCDGVRCDMAMLILPDVFERTWGVRPKPFWEETIQRIRSTKQDFLLMAEVYWDLEWTLQQQGFDYTYDKRLYDRLRDLQAHSARDHFRADMDFQRKSARFLENHDEPRAAATFPPEVHPAAAVLTFLCPGLRFFHDGEFEGRTKKLSVHLGRRPDEAPNEILREFYERLLTCIHRPTAQDGDWQLVNCTPAWEGNWTSDCFICFGWQAAGRPPLLVAVNYAANQSQCYVQVPFGEFRGHSVQLKDLMGSAVYERDGDELLSRGLYLDLAPWGYHVFELSLLKSTQPSPADV
jgi:glycosidase